VSNHAKGLLITFIGALLLTFDTPTLRFVGGEAWSVLFLRMLLVATTVLVWWLVMTALKKSPPPLVNGKWGVVVSIFFSLANICFVSAIFATNVANVVFILALTPIFSALISFFWFRESPKPETWVAMIIALLGVGIIVWSDIGSGNLVGNLYAMATALFMAISFTVTRRSGKDLSMAAVLAGVFTAIITLFIGAQITIENIAFGWLFLNAVVIMPLSLSLLLLGPRLISAPEASLFLLLETVLAPIWVWLAIGEKVPSMTLAGGGVILLTLIAHAIYSLRRFR